MRNRRALVVVVGVLAAALVFTACVPPPTVDADGDGVSPPADCNDADATVYPGAPEIANDGVDSNCDGEDPVEVDPAPSDEVLSSEFAESLSFLHTGDGATQVGLDLGAIDEPTAAAVRGRALGVDGQPAPGVAVRVVGRPELGVATTGTDGAFTMLVPGGAMLILEFRLSGHAVVQRHADTPWTDYTTLEEVVMTPIDSAATVVDLDAGVDVAHVASTVADEDGARTASVLFRQQTAATMTLP
ncbi:MAG: putative metal-binding motif-containing protein, partial [Microthrixaceae bacterium]